MILRVDNKDDGNHDNDIDDECIVMIGIKILLYLSIEPSRNALNQLRPQRCKRASHW